MTQQPENKVDNDDTKSPYSLTIAAIKEKLSIHLHDHNTKYIYHDTFTSDDLRKCGFSDQQSVHFEGVSNFIDTAKKGHKGIQFAISIEENENKEMPHVGVIRISKQDDFFGTMNCIIKLKQTPRKKVDVMEDHINDLKKEIKQLKDENIELKKHILPTRSIIMWSGTDDNIPNGWALCNGIDNTPDLRNRFIVGASDDIKAQSTGGNQSHNHNITVQGHILTINEIPAHSHQTSLRYWNGKGSGPGKWALIDHHSNDIAALNSSSVGGGQAHSHQATSSVMKLKSNYTKTS